MGPIVTVQLRPRARVVMHADRGQIRVQAMRLKASSRFRWARRTVTGRKLRDLAVYKRAKNGPVGELIRSAYRNWRYPRAAQGSSSKCVAVWQDLHIERRRSLCGRDL